MHLDTSEFIRLFGMDYNAFQTQAPWKQQKMKKENKLF